MMPRWLYSLLLVSIAAPILSLIGGARLALPIFICAAIGIIPLAALIGRATEDLEYYVGPTAGGLLNATFGNAPELIIGFFALREGLISVVKASITGSIISNALLVLGGSLAIGGWRWGEQYFSNRDAGQYSAMLIMALAGFLLPFAASEAIKSAVSVQVISVALAIILLVIYVCYLALHIFHIRAKRISPRIASQQQSAQNRPGRARQTRPLAQPASTDEKGEEKENELEEAAVTGVLSQQRREQQGKPHLWLALLFLAVATIGTTWNSELLIGTIEPVARQLGWSTVFIGLVIIPIVGNAAEHGSSLIVAYKDRVDLSMAIAAGSSIQVATFVAPLLVLVSLFFSQRLDLLFSPLELMLLGLATILFTFVSLDGKSSWLEGLQLMAVYVMACVVFFFIPG
jgi:Ca2+:H+ antiporter